MLEISILTYIIIIITFILFTITYRKQRRTLKIARQYDPSTIKEIQKINPNFNTSFIQASNTKPIYNVLTLLHILLFLYVILILIINQMYLMAIGYVILQLVVFPLLLSFLKIVD